MWLSLNCTAKMKIEIDNYLQSLFVFSIVDTKQNAGSLLTQVSSIVFDALSHGTLCFALHGSSFNHFFQRI